MNNNKFTLEINGNLDYDKMSVNIIFDKHHFAILSCDQGIDKAMIEILDSREKKVVWKFEYHAFMSTLTRAYSKLKEVNEITD